MSTIDLLKQNYREGIRFPYPANAEALEQIRTAQPCGSANGGGTWLLSEPVLYEGGERLYLTVRKVAGVIMVQLQTRKELTA